MSVVTAPPFVLPPRLTRTPNRIGIYTSLSSKTLSSSLLKIRFPFWFLSLGGKEDAQ